MITIMIMIEKQKSPSQTLRDIYFSRRFVGWKSCISVFLCFLFRACGPVTSVVDEATYEPRSQPWIDRNIDR